MNRMLKVDKRLISDESGAPAPSPLDSGPRNFYMRVIRHQLPIMIVFMILSMALAALFVFTTVPTYVATASIVIDARKAQLLNPQSASRGEINVDTSMVQTEIELLKSDNVSRAVINQLNLTKDPEFAGGPRGFIGSLIDRVFSIFNLFGTPPVKDENLARTQLAKGVLGAFARQTDGHPSRSKLCDGDQRSIGQSAESSENRECDRGGLYRRRTRSQISGDTAGKRLVAGPPEGACARKPRPSNRPSSISASSTTSSIPAVPTAN